MTADPIGSAKLDCSFLWEFKGPTWRWIKITSKKEGKEQETGELQIHLDAAIVPDHHAKTHFDFTHLLNVKVNQTTSYVLKYYYY